MRLILIFTACLLVVSSVAFYSGYTISENQFKAAIAVGEAGHCDDFNHYMRDYQIDLYVDTVWIYDKDRLVGRFTSKYTSQYDSILLKDNE